MRSIHIQAVQRSPEHRLLARFLPRSPGARYFLSFDKVGRPQLRSHSCASSKFGSTHPSCDPLIYIAEETCVCVHRPVVAANYAAAASWVAAAISPSIHVGLVRAACSFRCALSNSPSSLVMLVSGRDIVRDRSTACAHDACCKTIFPKREPSTACKGYSLYRSKSNQY